MKETLQEPHANLQQLGKQVSYPTSPENALLEAIPCQWNDSGMTIHITCHEFTCLCPLTKQPDFAKIYIEYKPNKHLIESKSLKLYLGSFRNTGIFHEYVVHKICEDLFKILSPHSIEVRGEFSVRGGITITPVAKRGMN